MERVISEYFGPAALLSVVYCLCSCWPANQWIIAKGDVLIDIPGGIGYKLC